jgi:hypothetical protein
MFPCASFGFLSLTARVRSATSTLPASTPTDRKWANSYNLLQHFLLFLPFHISPPPFPNLKPRASLKLRLHPRRLPHCPHSPYPRMHPTSVCNRYLSLPLIALPPTLMVGCLSHRRPCHPQNLRTPPGHKIPPYKVAPRSCEHMRRHHIYGCRPRTCPASLLDPPSRKWASLRPCHFHIRHPLLPPLLVP